VSWKVVIRAEAEAELAEAALWYEEQEPDLGRRFVETVRVVWSQLSINPRVYSRRDRKKDVRFAPVGRFSYFVVYEIRDLERLIVVASILHTARDERRWRKRFD